MALPALEGEIRLTDNSGATLKNFVSATTTADAGLTKLQSTAAQTDTAVSKLGQSGALKNFVSAVAPAESALTGIQAQAAATNSALAGLGQRTNVSGLTSQLGTLAAEEALTTAEAQRMQAALSQLNQAQGLAPLVQGLATANTEAQQLNATLAKPTTQGNDPIAALVAEGAQRKAVIAQLADATGVSEKRITSIVDSESHKRTADTAAEVAQRKALIAQLAAATGASEKQITAQLESEIAKRRADQAGTQGGGANIGGLLQGGLAAVGVTLGAQTIRQVADQAIELTKLGTEAQRTGSAFTILSGGADQAQEKLLAVQRASGGAVDKLSAMGIANKAAVLGIASTADQLGRVTQFATVASRVLGGDVTGTLDNLAAAAANLSFVRLDQMGISSTQVRARMEQLRGTMKGLTDSQLFLEATLQVGEGTFGALGDSAITSASGLEILTAKFKDLKTELATGVSGALDPLFRQISAIGGNADLNNLGQIAQKAAAGLRDSALPDVGGFAATNASKFDLLATAIQSAAQAQKQGLPGATEYGAKVAEMAINTNRFGIAVGFNEQALSALVAKYGEGTAAATAFTAVQSSRTETGVIDQLQAKLDALKGTQGGILDTILGKVDTGEISNLEAVISAAKERIAKGEPITLDARLRPVVEAQLGGDIAANLPSPKLFTDLAAATAEARNQADLLTVSQQGLASGVVTQSQLAQVQSNKDLADSDVQIIQAKQQVAQANIAYANSLTSTDAAVKQSAQSDKEAADKALNVATARRSAVDAAGQLASAQAQLAAAQAVGNGEDAALLQTTIAIAQANKAAADSALQLASGQSAVDAAATASADAWKAYEAAIRDIQASTIGMIDAQTGLPVAFNSATTSGAQLSTVLQQLARDERNLAASAASSAFALGASLAPQLGVAGALQQGNQFRQQAASIVSDFNSINTAREQAGQAPFGNDVLQASLSNLGAYQQAYVSDMRSAGDEAEKAGSRQEKAFDKANKAVQSALSSIVASVVKPSTSGLIEGAGLSEKDLASLLPREDAIDEKARRLADVAVKGFKSPFIGQFKDIIPPDIFAAGELAIRKFAAQKVRLNTEGLDTDLLNIDAATNKVLEKIQGKQKTDEFIANISQRVQGLAPSVGITDIKSALGIDTTAEQIGGAVSTGIKSALTGVLNFDQIREQMNAALTGVGTTGQSPLTAGLTIKETDKATIVASGKTATTETGEAAVAQMDTGKYGERMVSTITAQVAAKKADAEKAGKDLAGWLGGSLLTNFKESVPAGLLSILTDKLVPLIQAAQAAANERTVGAGVAP